MATLQRRAYGKAGDRLSIVGLGGVLLMKASPEQARAIVARAVEAGVNYFDVAPTYGNAEELLGPALEPFRKDCFLACKTVCRDAAGARQELMRSLERLRTDHLDLYQLHALNDLSKDVEVAFGKGGVVELLAEIRKSGLARHVGFSTHSAAAAGVALERFDFDSILMPVNYGMYFAGQFGPAVLEQARARGVTVLAIKALCRGPWPVEFPKGSAERVRYDKCWYRPLTDRGEMELALRFALSQPIAAALPPGEEELYWPAVEMAQRFVPITAAETEGLKELAGEREALFGVAT